MLGAGRDDGVWGERVVGGLGTWVAMRRFELIRREVQLGARFVETRVVRIQDALRGLRQLTLALDAMSAGAPPSEVEAWLEAQGFGVDPHGYFERPELLERARAGVVEPDKQIYYAVPERRTSPEAMRKMYALRGFVPVLSTLHETFPEIAWFYYQDAERFTIAYPMHDPCTVVPADFDWHTYLTYVIAGPDNNPERGIRWTPPNIDYGGKGLMVAPSIPIYRGDDLYGVWSIDLPVAMLIKASVIETVVPGQESFIVDKSGTLVAHSNMASVCSTRHGEVVRRSMSELGGGYAELDAQVLWSSGEAAFVDEHGVARRALAQPLEGVDWLLVATFPDLELVERLRRSFEDVFQSALSGEWTSGVPAVGGALQPLVEGFNEMTLAAHNALAEKEAQAKTLEESQNYTRALFDASPVGLALLSPQGVCLEANDELCRILSSQREHLVGNLFWERLPASAQQEVDALVDVALSGVSDAQAEVEMKTAAGALVPVRIQARAFRLGARGLLLWSIEDITRQRALQTQVLQTQKMHAIGRLAGGVAHDFNNLLTVIMSNASILQMVHEPETEEFELVESLLFASKRAAALTSRLLTFSRKELVQPRQLDLKAVVEESERLLERLLDDDVVLDVEIASDLPPVVGDEGQTLQIVMNLVVNARDALKDGGRIELRVYDFEDKDGRGVRLEVEDDGVGMDETTQLRIFEPFFTTRSHGTGLGLATVREVVRDMGGTIDVRSRPGEGACFTVTFWAAPALPPTVSAGRQDRQRERFHGVVVVVDDDPLVRAAVGRTLKRHGVHVQIYSDGRSALASIEKLGDEAALLVTDVVMMGMNGRVLANKAQALCPGLPVLFMSGYTDDEILRKGLQTKGIHLLRKPFMPQQLLDAMASACVWCWGGLVQTN